MRSGTELSPFLRVFLPTPVNVKHNGLCPSRVAHVYIETSGQSAVSFDIMCQLRKLWENKQN